MSGEQFLQHVRADPGLDDAAHDAPSHLGDLRAYDPQTPFARVSDHHIHHRSALVLGGQAPVLHPDRLG